MPLLATFDLDVYSQSVLRVVRPGAFDFKSWSPCEEEEEEDMSAQCLLELEEQWLKALKDNDVNALWEAWSKAAEEYLVQRSQGRIQKGDERKHEGRHANRAPTKTYLAARQYKETCGAQTLKQRQLQRMTRRAEELYRQVLRLSSHGPGQTPLSLDHLWSNVREDAAKLLGPNYSSTALKREKVPRADECLQFVHQMQNIVQECMREQRQTRSTEWTNTLQRQYVQGGQSKGNVYKAFRRKPEPPVSFLNREDGGFTANAVEIDNLVHKAWMPIFRAYSSEPEPEWEPFSARFGAHIAKYPMQLQALEGKHLRQALEKMEMRRQEAWKDGAWQS